MIAGTVFGAPVQGVRRLRFVPRASIPVAAACLVANALRETLRPLLGPACEVVVGEPTALDAESWAVVSRNAALFCFRGRQTDIVLVVPERDARTLVLQAFGERDAGAGCDANAVHCSALERQALDRIASRFGAAFDALCAERRGACRRIAAHEVQPCAAYVDVRVQAPVALTLGVAIVRDLPDPGPSGSLSPAALDRVGVEARVVLGHGKLNARSFVALRPGDVVTLDTKLSGTASLRVAGRALARGAAGVSGSHAAFFVHELTCAAGPA